ncbi:KHK [Bugula neritina]|uniref:KHK n=1 Tax=Bugula neritina TaxID=10212 RepID=A0A7J7JMI9_BUGNE|nr:KHK [Bugula neritina]
MAKSLESSDNVLSILSIGLVVIDIMTEVETYPVEDTKSRSNSIHERVGGNAASNSIVLSLLGEKASFMGVVGTTKHHLELIKDTFSKYGVDYSSMIECAGHAVPQTVCIICKETGSRTCVHYRGSLPELSFSIFTGASLNFSLYKWIHFEGRYDYQDTHLSIQHCRDVKDSKGYDFKISVEIEKASAKLERLLDSPADYIFISKDFSIMMGYADMMQAVAGFSQRVKSGVTVVCPWGSSGAAAQTNGAEAVWTPAFPPKETVNTLGAGDTFIAACIKALCHSSSLSTAVRYACQVAGAKCGLREIDQLSTLQFELE